MTCSAKVRTRPSSATISSHSGELVSTATRSSDPPDCSRHHAKSACPWPWPREEGCTSPVAVRCPEPSTEDRGRGDGVTRLVGADDARPAEEVAPQHRLAREVGQAPVALEAAGGEVVERGEVGLGHRPPDEVSTPGPPSAPGGAQRRPDHRPLEREPGEGRRRRSAATRCRHDVRPPALVDAHLDVRREDADEEGRRAPAGDPAVAGCSRPAAQAISTTPLAWTRSRLCGRRAGRSPRRPPGARGGCTPDVARIVARPGDVAAEGRGAGHA